MSTRVITAAELARHNSRSDCWVAIHGKVYDVTSFLSEHPAGAAVILKQAGKDATAAFEPFHASDIIDRMGLEDRLRIGVYDGSGSGAAAAVAPAEEVATSGSKFVKPSLDRILNVHEFEVVARNVMKAPAWDYYSSGADDEITLRENRLAFHRIWLRPRVMVDVSSVDMSTTILGYPSSFPVSSVCGLAVRAVC